MNIENLGRRVDEKVAIVTGGSSAEGLGFATAKALAREGAKVIFTGTNEAALADRTREMAAAGLEAFGMRQDVTSEEDWGAVVAAAFERYGRLNILVNNAGMTVLDTVDEMALENWNRVIGINLTGSFLGCKHVVRAFRRQGGGGSLINVASTGGLVGFKRGSAYAASKGGVRQLTKTVALEGAEEGIRCNTVFPGVILTEIFKPLLAENPKHFDAHLARIPMARLGEPEDIAQCILFLSSDEAKYITGAEFVVDGGLTSQ